MFIAYKGDSKHEEVYYESCLPDKYKKYAHICGNIISLRNILILLTFIEIASSVWGFSYFFIKRSLIYVIVNILALLLSGLGVLSVIYVNELGLIIYSLLTTSLPGTFFFYQIFELFAVSNTSYGGSRLNDNILMLVFSLPYLYDFSVGVVTIIFMSRIAHFNGVLQRIRHEDEEAAKKLLDEEIKNLNQKYSYEYLQEQFQLRESSSQGIDTCIICMNEKRQVMNMPCKDILLCLSCKDALVSKYGASKCPKCRQPITEFTQFYT